MRPTDEEILSAYNRLGSVWLAGDELGIAGQTVHKRMRKVGVGARMNHLTDDDKSAVRKLYTDGFIKGDGRLDSLAETMRRTKAFICRYAKSEGLTNTARPLTESLKEDRSKQMKRVLATNPHPKGMAGKKHTEGAKMRMSWMSKAKRGDRSDAEQSLITRKQLRTRMDRYGTLVPPRSKVSWKQGWRELGGAKIYFRSRWEYNYAVYLQWLVDRGEITKWEHEPETFWFDGIKRGCVTYLPDFRITNKDASVEYHEVKGWMDDRSKTKLKRMAKYYPSVKLRVIDGKWFKANGPKLAFLSGWEK